jgi:hypothetical protein
VRTLCSCSSSLSNVLLCKVRDIHFLPCCSWSILWCIFSSRWYRVPLCTLYRRKGCVCVVSHYSEPNTTTHYTEKLLDSVASIHHSVCTNSPLHCLVISVYAPVAAFYHNVTTTMTTVCPPLAADVQWKQLSVPWLLLLHLVVSV